MKRSVKKWLGVVGVATMYTAAIDGVVSNWFKASQLSSRVAWLVHLGLLFLVTGVVFRERSRRRGLPGLLCGFGLVAACVVAVAALLRDWGKTYSGDSTSIYFMLLLTASLLGASVLSDDDASI